MTIIVVGLGGMGSQTLWRLAVAGGFAGKGERVIGVEQFGIGHDRGSSHGESRIIRSAYSEGSAYVPLILRSWRLWRELERISGANLVTRTGGLMIGSPDSATVAGSVSSATTHGLAHEVLAADELRRRYPQHLIADNVVGVHEPNAGIVRPEAAVRSAASAAAALGAEILTGSQVIEIIPSRERPRVILADGELTASHVIVASGAWLPRLVPGLSAHLRPVRRVMGWFRTIDGPAFSPGRFPVFARELGEDRILYGFGSLDGETAKVALHHWPGLDEIVDPATGPRPPDNADAALLAEVVAATLTGLDPEPVRMKECTYTMTPDEHFVIGGRTDLPGLTVLGGFSGHGFKFAPVVGELAAQLALTGRSDLPLDLFDPYRF